eukprot:7082082-Heterocapsa_arctica.AAC.1
MGCPTVLSPPKNVDHRLTATPCRRSSSAWPVIIATAAPRTCRCRRARGGKSATYRRLGAPAQA